MEDSDFISRRSPVLSAHACVSSNVPIVSKIGIDILQAGGNAADAGVAMTAALAVVEPQSTGIGGDCFCLFYRKSDKKVLGINGNGRSSSRAMLDMAKCHVDENGMLPNNHGLTVTVPGNIGGWIDIIEKFGSGKLLLKEILAPSIKLAEEGFPVARTISASWESKLQELRKARFGKELLLNGRAPKEGEIMKLPAMAATLKEISKNGKKGFYSGCIAEKVASEVQFAKGCMTVEDLENHLVNPPYSIDPICTEFHGVKVWEIPPVGQGLVVLLCLNILEGFDLKDLKHNSSAYLHIVAESLRLAFADGQRYIADHPESNFALPQLLDKKYASERRKLIQMDRVLPVMLPGSIEKCSSDTVYVTAVDEEGNACSLISSLYEGFGSTIVPEGCGFALNNRGLNFSLKCNHPNAFGPSKFPYHTIIPSMLTDSRTGELLGSFGIVGGFMQPQAQVQVLLNMIIFGMDPQTAINQPRIYLDVKIPQQCKYMLMMENGIKKEAAEALRLYGHDVHYPVSGFDRLVFGRGHIITRGSWWKEWKGHLSEDNSNVLWAGCDPRSDGIAIGY